MRLRGDSQFARFFCFVFIVIGASNANAADPSFIDFAPPENIVGIDYVSSAADGTITIQGRNLCPNTWNGGQIRATSEFGYFLSGVAMVGGQLKAIPPVNQYAPIPGTYTGSYANWPLGGSNAPPPVNSINATLTGIFDSKAYVHQMTCYYSRCTALGGVNCEWDYPTHVTAINIGRDFDLKIDSVRVEQPAGTPVEVVDGKPLIDLKKPADVVALVSGVNLGANDNRTVLTDVKVQDIVQGTGRIRIGDLAAGPKTIRFALPGGIYSGATQFEFTVGRSNALTEINFTNNVSTTTVSQKQETRIQLDSIRLAQRIFNPSVSNGQRIDLVTGKPFAAEVQVSANGFTSSSNIPVHIDLMKDDVKITSSLSFNVRDVVAGSKIFIPASQTIDGTSTLKAKLIFENATDVTTYAKDDGTQEQSISVNFHSTSLRLTTIPILGCTTTSNPCFTPPSAPEIASIEQGGVAFAQQILPVSSGRLSVQRTDNPIVDSYPDSFQQIYIDAVKGYFLAKPLSDIALMIVSRDYLVKTGQDTEGSSDPVFGLTLPQHPSVTFVTPTLQRTTAHELYHVLSNSNLLAGEHSNQFAVDGFGETESQIWTDSGRSLGGQAFKPLATNLMVAGLDETTQLQNINVDPSFYNSALLTLTSGFVDPDALVVGAVLNDRNEVVYSQVMRTTTNLDPQLQGEQVVVEGLDQNGAVLSSVSTPKINQISVDRLRSGTSLRNTAYSAFMTTLPFVSGIRTVRAKINGLIVLSKPILQPLTLDRLINGLVYPDFQGSVLAQRLLLAAVKVEYAEYTKLKAKPNKAAAKLSLLILRDTLRIGLKQTFELSSGEKVDLGTVLDLVNNELKLFK